MSNTQLCQIVAVEKGLKTRIGASVTEIYHLLQKPQLFSGLSRVYTPVDDEGEMLPAESTLVQKNVEDLLGEVGDRLTQLFDVVVTKETGNMRACAPVVVEGNHITPPLPVPFLLFLEKQLVDLRTMVSKAPVLDPADVWNPDPSVGGHRTNPVSTSKTKKVPEVLVKYAATDKHPAQTEVLMMDRTTGTWETTKFSGALPTTRRAELISRIDALSDAVKAAREQANSTEVEQISIGDQIFSYLLR